MENGKIRLRNGQPIMVDALSKAIGFANDLEVVVHEISVEEHLGFLLCSDGFYGLNDFDSLATDVYAAVDICLQSSLVAKSITSRISDDASMAIVRISSQTNIDVRALIQNDGDSGIPSFVVKDALDTELEQALEQKDDYHVGQILSYMDNNRISFKRERMIELLELMISLRSEHQGLMVSMIKRLPLD